MAFRSEDKEQWVSCEITGTLNVSEVADIRDEIIVCLSARNKIVLDLNGVVDCDSAGVQLLCSAQKTAASQGKELTVVRAPAVVRESAARVGLRLVEDLGCQKEV
jgi:anti-anti-sigma factor